MTVRKNAETLPLDERLELVNGLRALKANGTYDKFVLAHARAKMNHIHRCPAFLPWHRAFLLELERDLQSITDNPDLAIPYWAWPNGGADAKIWQAHFMGGDGVGPFNGGHWTIIDSNGNPAGPLVREFGQNIAGLPTQADIDQTLDTAPYDFAPWDMSSTPSFRNRLEGWYGSPMTGMHNRGHVWVGGSMLPMTSPNDPIFFLHHCFVDKIWSDWQTASPANAYAPDGTGPLNPGQRLGQNLNDAMERTVYDWTRVADVLNIESLNYRYDDLLLFGADLRLKSHHRGLLAPGSEDVVEAVLKKSGARTKLRLVNPKDLKSEDVLRHGETLALLTDNQRYLTAQADGVLVVSETVAGARARFTIVNPREISDSGPVRYGDRISLRSDQGRYLSAELDGRVKANRTAIGPWEEWRVA